MPRSNTTLGLKKGAWSADEDKLLKDCIEKQGEGKWHLVPLKTGLNRCRKSCRLRWLNYLRPNIKRGDFGEDEVDLMLRLHKLLGNRWSWIAGRIPGRTANDVKNYWNTHIDHPRSLHQKKEPNDEESLRDTTITVIKPQPHGISTTLNWYMGDNSQIVSPHGGGNLIISSNDNAPSGLSLSPSVLDDNINKYLDELFDDDEMEIGENVGWSSGDSLAKGEALKVVEQEDDENCLFDFQNDDGMWNLMDSDQL